MTNKEKVTFLTHILAKALQLQSVLFIGFAFCFLCSLFYYFVDDVRFPQENLWVMVSGLAMSGGSVLLGKLISKKNGLTIDKNSYFYGAWLVTFTWIISCTISALFFIFAGFPDPLHVHSYTFFSTVY